MKRFGPMVSRTALCAAALLAGYGLHAYAQDNSASEPLFYGGTVSNKDGTPLEGSHAVTLRLFGQETGGSSVCATPQLKVDFTAGRFRIELPSGAGGCSEAIASTSVWTELTVDTETMPRSRVGAVPFAVRANTASVAQSLVGEQAQTLSALQAKVDSLPATPTASGGALSYRVITTPSDCVYDASVNSTRCTCLAGEIATSGGAWAGAGNILSASRLDYRPQDNVSPAERVRVWSVSCVTPTGNNTPCVYVQAICIKSAI
ncbi:MAG: hypothetical protein JWN48_5150 [Myxococcaceae bacterium]|nr:hypothetical protein [Myxococcaceae bacterium]